MIGRLGCLLHYPLDRRRSPLGAGARTSAPHVNFRFFRAERRIGELMSAAKDVGQIAEGRPQKNGFEENPFPRVTLKDAGIDKNLADRARKYAAIPQKQFDGMLSERRRSRIQKQGH